MVVSGTRNTIQDKSSSQQYQREELSGRTTDWVTEGLYDGGPRNTSPVKSSSHQEVAVGPATTLLDNVRSQPADQGFAQPQPTQVQQQPIVTTVPSPIVDSIDVDHYVRPVRARQAPQRLVVGNPLDPHFNRTRGQ